jgi:hypothetical protein
MTQKILTIAPLLMFLAAIYTVSMFAVFAAVAFLAIRYYESFVFYEMEKPTIAVQAVLLLAHIGVFFFTHFEPQNSTLFADVPLELMEYLVKTYTNEGDMVLDNTMGSGTTNLACIKLNRKSIGIEKEKQYYDVAVRRASEYCH